MSYFKIIPNPDLPVRDAVFGWRAITSKLFNWPRRAIVAVFVGNSSIETHPDNVPSVAGWLTARGRKYVITPKIAAVPSVTK